MPEVSVVVPTRNRSPLLLQAVRSVLDQRDVSFELVVVDDGSEDDTRSSVAALADPRVKLLAHESSRGVAAARNRGVAEASGGWIAFLDDDDLWAPDKLRRQLAAARESGRGWVYAGAVSVDGCLRIVSSGAPPSPEEVLRDLLLRNPVPAGASNVVVRRDLLDPAPAFDTTLRHLADWDLWIRLGLTAPPAVVLQPLVAYRVHDGNASLDTEAILGEFRVIEQRYAAARGRVPADRAYVYRWIAWNRLRSRDRVGATKAYLAACGAGDLASLGRAAVGLLHPGITGRRARGRNDVWRTEVEAWLDTIALRTKSAPARGH